VHRRGAVWTTDLPGAGRRPVVLISARVVTLHHRPVVARIESAQLARRLPTTVPLGANEIEGLPRQSCVLAHEPLTLPLDALVAHLGWLRAERMLEVDAAVMTALGINPRWVQA
jgi:mRNA-degrading endonuclease toxin of MazEF toxin-antitoxin module